VSHFWYSFNSSFSTSSVFNRSSIVFENSFIFSTFPVVSVKEGNDESHVHYLNLFSLLLYQRKQHNAYKTTSNSQVHFSAFVVYTLVPATSLGSLSRCESSALAILSLLDAVLDLSMADNSSVASNCCGLARPFIWAISSDRVFWISRRDRLVMKLAAGQRTLKQNNAQPGRTGKKDFYL